MGDLNMLPRYICQYLPMDAGGAMMQPPPGVGRPLTDTASTSDGVHSSQHTPYLVIFVCMGSMRSAKQDCALAPWALAAGIWRGAQRAVSIEAQ